MSKGDVIGVRPWPLFSAAALRRKLLESIICGGGGGYVSRHNRDKLEPSRSERADSDRRRLVELLEEDNEINKKASFLEELKIVVRNVQFEGSRKESALEIRRLAKDNAQARETISMLGAIPPLVGMIDFDGDEDLQIASLYALLNLGIGNDVNKAAIAKAGAVHKMLNLVESGCSQALSDAIIANFLGLSALDSNKTIIGASGAISFLVKSFRNATPKSQSRLDSLRALYNFSICPSNVAYIVEEDLVLFLFSLIGDMEVTDKALAVISNIVGTPEGRRTVSRSPEGISILVDVLNWCDSPECQEKAAYILMIMAYKSCNDRTRAVESGITSALLELTLMGTALAQKRASRILEILRVDKGKQISEGFSRSNAPPLSSILLCEDEEEMENLSEERKAVKELVQQSLQSNLRRIARRANLPLDYVTPSDRFLGTSKSLPF